MTMNAYDLLSPAAVSARIVISLSYVGGTAQSQRPVVGEASQ